MVLRRYAPALWATLTGGLRVLYQLSPLRQRRLPENGFDSHHCRAPALGTAESGVQLTHTFHAPKVHGYRLPAALPSAFAIAARAQAIDPSVIQIPGSANSISNASSMAGAAAIS